MSLEGGSFGLGIIGKGGDFLDEGEERRDGEGRGLEVIFSEGI